MAGRRSLSTGGSDRWCRPLKRTLLFSASLPGTYVPGYHIPSLRDCVSRTSAASRTGGSFGRMNAAPGAIAAYRSNAARHRTSTANSLHLRPIRKKDGVAIPRLRQHRLLRGRGAVELEQKHSEVMMQHGVFGP